MSRRVPRRLETSGDIRAAVHPDEESEEEYSSLTESDTDSLPDESSDDYEPSDGSWEDFEEESVNLEALRLGDSEGRDAPEVKVTPMKKVFGRKRRKSEPAVGTRGVPDTSGASFVLPSPLNLPPIPPFSSTPMAPQGRAERDGDDADDEHDFCGFEPPKKQAKRQLFMDDLGEDSESDPDDPPPRIYFPPAHPRATATGASSSSDQPPPISPPRLPSLPRRTPKRRLPSPPLPMAPTSPTAEAASPVSKGPTPPDSPPRSRTPSPTPMPPRAASAPPTPTRPSTPPVAAPIAAPVAARAIRRPRPRARGRIGGRNGRPRVLGRVARATGRGRAAVAARLPPVAFPARGGPDKVMRGQPTVIYPPKPGKRPTRLQQLPDEEKNLYGPVDVAPGWTWEDGDDFVPQQFDFQPGAHVPGPRVDIPVGDQYPRAAVFQQFITENLVTQIVESTNKYNYYRQAGKIQAPRSLYQWFHPITLAEMYVFLGLIILMGTIKKPTLDMYWTVDPFLATPAFGRAMSRTRFQQIMGNLHFIDSLESHTVNQDRAKKDKDPLERIRLVYDYIRLKIKSAHNPYQKLIIDESLLLWRGNISFRQYIPSKRHKYGLKTYVLCDCKSGYVQDVLLYVGEATELVPVPTVHEDAGKSGSAVLTLLQGHLDKGHILYTDNFYTSPSLCQLLAQRNTGTCGTTRFRKFMPSLPKYRDFGSVIYKKANGILLVSWIDRKMVNLLTTVNVPRTEPSRRRQRGTGAILDKPATVNDYNINMRLVDKKDQVVASAEVARTTMKWYKKFFFHLVDVVLYNSNIIYKKQANVNQSHVMFCVELARELILKYKDQPRPRVVPHHPRQDPLPDRLTGRHFPREYPPIPTCSSPRRRCYVCSHTTRGPSRRQDTRYFCPVCNVGLCVSRCFEDFHTLQNY